MNTILVVDDQVQCIRIYQDFLTDEGFKVIGADSLQEAVTILAYNNDVDIIILDYSISDVDSGVFLQTLKDTCSHTKILMNSCHPVEYQRKMIQEVDGYHDKCAGLDDLLSNIKKVLSVENI